MHRRCGATFSYHFIPYLPLSWAVKEFVEIGQHLEKLQGPVYLHL